MKNLVFLIVVVSILLVGCGSSPDKTTRSRPDGTSYMTTPSPAASPTPDEQDLTPDTIAISALRETFTAWPDCDGAECSDAEFTVAVKLKGEEKLLTVIVADDVRGEKGTTKKQLDEFKKTYATMKALDPLKTIITLKVGKIVRISTAEELNGKTYVPKQVLWDDPYVR